MINENTKLKVVLNRLIPIYEDKENRRVVNARELHAFLESKRQFGNWIQERIEKYDFVENVDFSTFNIFVKRDDGKGLGTTLKEYLITIDVAKEIAMVENNERGRQVRQYFIECEKRLNGPYLGPQPGDIIDGKKIPETYTEAMIELGDTLKIVLALEADNARMKPKEEKYDEFIGTNVCYSGLEAARLLNFKDMGRNRLYEVLRDHNIFMANNLPYQHFIEKGWFLCKVDIPYPVPLFTAKGLDGLRDFFIERGYEFADAKQKDISSELIST